MSVYTDLLPALASDEFASLKADIRERGAVLVPLEVDEHGTVIDGCHRLRAVQELRAEGIKIPDPLRVVRPGLSDAQKRSLARALNLARRHLNQEKRRTLIEAELRERPEQSNRQVAATLGVDHKTVGAVREGLAGRGEIPHVSKVTDTLGRSQPATRPTPPPVPPRPVATNPPAPATVPPPPPPPKPIIVETPRQMEKVQQLAQAGRLQAVQSTRDIETVHRAMRQEERKAEAAAAPAPPPETVPADIRQADVTESWPLAQNSVDLIVTSPPYGIEIDYAVGDIDANEWFDFMQVWLSEAYRVTRPTGRLCLNVPLDTNKGGWRPTYADAVEAATGAGWTYRTTIVWNEGNVSSSVARGSVDSHAAVNVVAPVEMIAVFFKEFPSPDQRGNGWPRADGDTADIPHEDWLAWTNGLWTFHGESRAHDAHPAAFPEELPRRLILLFSGRGATVLDPFNGSGTTTLVAHRLGRKAIGFDNDPAWVASAQRRLAAALEVQARG